MKITKSQLKQIIKEELKEALEKVDYDNPQSSWGANDQENLETDRSYTSSHSGLQDLDREVEAMLQSQGALDQRILAKVDSEGAKYLKMNDRQTTPTPMSNMADADLRVLHLYARRALDGKNVNTVSQEDATLAYQQFTEIDREISKRGLSY